MKYSAGQAAKAAGVATSTVTRALKTGKISGEKVEGGGWLLDPAEFHRVFPPVKATRSRKSQTLGSATPVFDSQNNGFERLVEALERQITDLQRERDKWQEEAAHLRRLLPVPPEASRKAVGGFWARLWGKGAAND